MTVGVAATQRHISFAIDVLIPGNVHHNVYIRDLSCIGKAQNLLHFAMRAPLHLLAAYKKTIIREMPNCCFARPSEADTF